MLIRELQRFLYGFEERILKILKQRVTVINKVFHTQPPNLNIMPKMNAGKTFLKQWPLT